MRKSNKIMSLFLMLVMMLSVVIPTLVKAEPPEVQKTKVIIHKILLPNEKALQDHTDVGKNPQYDGNKIEDLKKYFGAESKEIGKVAFDIYKEDLNGDVQGSDARFEGVAESSKKYKQVGKTVLTVEGKGAEFPDLENGNYIIVENKEKTTYIGADGATLSNSKAVPAKFTLPMTLPDGSGYFNNDSKPLHLYPKNTESAKPTIEKKLADNHQGDKNGVTVGEEVPYEVKTLIKAGSAYKTLSWGDTVSTGLTYKKGLTITADNNVVFDENDYKLTETDKGFLLTLTKTGLDKVAKITAPETAKPIQGQNKNLTITLKYSATVNENAVIENPLDNTVTLHYGNNPNFVPEPEDNNPPPVKPKEKQITVNKSFITGDGTNKNLDWPEDAEVILTLKVYNPTTNKWEDTNKTEKLTKGQYSVTFIGLEENKIYKVVEKEIKGWVPNYTIGPDGNLVIKNKKNDNPPPITPDPVVVTTYGKKFVKVDQSHQDQFLPGAKFRVMNENKDKYLALKDAEQIAKEQKEYIEAQDAYLKAVKDSASNVNQLKIKRDNAYKAMKMQWKWVEKSQVANAFVLISDEKGKFEIKGLAKGTYHLEEFKAPDGYVLPQGENVFKKFEVGPGTYSDAQAQKVNNVKISIPQTGGMGAVVVVLCGLAVVGLGLAIKKKINS